MTPRQVVDYMMEKDNFSQFLGIRLIDIQENYASIEMTVTNQMLNGLGTVHGGVIFAVADSAFAFASNNDGNAAVAMSVSINFTKASREGDILRATSKLINDTRKTALYDISITNQNNQLVAKFLGVVYKIGKKVVEL